jgi:hypothetical protein
LHDYRIFETDQFARDLKRIARSGHPAIVRKLRRVVYSQLGRHPHVGPHIRKLKSYTPDTWRIGSAPGGFSMKSTKASASCL